VPEVADLRATLQVLDDPTADAALLRLLTGARWRIGPATWPPSGGGPAARARRRRVGRRPGGGGRPRASTSRRSARSSTRSTTCLPRVSATRCRPKGRRRLEALRDELRALRRRVDQPLPDLVGDVERTLGLDVEVSARPGTTDPAAARADLDAFADAAAQFAGDVAQDGAGEAVLSAFLAHLSAAEDEEHGLDTGAVSGADTVKLMTVHAAKGLEWAVVAVPGLARSTTAGRRSSRPGRRPAPRGRPTSGCCPSRCAATAPTCPGLHGLEPEDVTAHLAPSPPATPARSGAGLRRRHPGRAPAAVLGLPLGRGRHRRGPSVFLDEARAACLDGAGEVARG
jgi:DNA helicase-2/ATP-dependent DNA helicase PcrA